VRWRRATSRKARGRIQSREAAILHSKAIARRRRVDVGEEKVFAKVKLIFRRGSSGEIPYLRRNSTASMVVSEAVLMEKNPANGKKNDSRKLLMQANVAIDRNAAPHHPGRTKIVGSGREKGSRGGSRG